MRNLWIVLAGIATVLTLGGCTTSFSYKPTLTLGEVSTTIRASARVEPFIDESPSSDKSLPLPPFSIGSQNGSLIHPDSLIGDLASEVTNAFINDCKVNHLFEVCQKSLSSPDILIKGRILRFYGKVGASPLGLTPLALLSMYGVPVMQDDVGVRLEISLYRPDGTLLDRYDESAESNKWFMMYSQSQVVNRLNSVFAETVKKIRDRMIAKEAKYARIGPRKDAPGLGAMARVIPPEASEVDQLPANRVRPNPNAYALVVGIEQYRQGLPSADFSVHDAEIVDKYLTGVLGYPQENVVKLLNDRATKTDLEKYVESWLPNRVGKDDTVFLYFSGHGAPDPQTGDAYLIPYDGDPAFVEKTGYPLKRFYDSLGKLPAKQVVVMLDSCFSGAGGRSVVAKGMRPMFISVENPVLATSGKMVVLTASAGNQVSSTYLTKGHGLLTYFFLKGLKGEGDRNNDGGIDLAELFAYIKSQVENVARREFNNEQTPQLLGSPELLSRGVKLVERTSQ